MKKLHVGLAGLITAAAVLGPGYQAVGTTGGAQAESPCADGNYCLYAEPDFGGKEYAYKEADVAKAPEGKCFPNENGAVRSIANNLKKIAIKGYTDKNCKEGEQTFQPGKSSGDVKFLSGSVAAAG